MPEFVRTVISHLHALVATSNGVNSRAVSLPLTIYLLPSNEGKGAVIRSSCDGLTYDFSRTGLSFIVRSLRIGNSHMFYDINSRLLIRIGLPGGLVEMYVKPVRFDSWGGSEIDPKFIVGARIVEISKSDHARYMEFLRNRRPMFANVINPAASNSDSAVST